MPHGWDAEIANMANARLAVSLRVMRKLGWLKVPPSYHAATVKAGT